MTEKPQDRHERIQRIIDQCRQRLAEGRGLPDKTLIQQFPHLMPDLGRELKKLRMVEQAKQAAAEQKGPAQATRPPALPPRRSDDTPSAPDLDVTEDHQPRHQEKAPAPNGVDSVSGKALAAGARREKHGETPAASVLLVY